MARLSHDALFKQLLTHFFREFLDLAAPDVAVLLDNEPLVFLDKEQVRSAVNPKRREADIVVRAKLRTQPTTILIHLEHQAQNDVLLARRMFRYFARFHDQHDLPIVPIALCSYASPQRAAPAVYAIQVGERAILHFQFQVLQLNRLDWRTFVQTTNPVAVALMKRMAVAPADQWRVKAASLRALAGLRLTSTQQQLISQFIDVYLRLPPTQEQRFRQEIAQFGPYEQEVVMQVIGSWEQRGIELGIAEGREKGRIEGQQAMLVRLLNRKLGAVSAPATAHIQQLAATDLLALEEALFDFRTHADLDAWLAARPVSTAVQPDSDDLTT